jgi:hypothetical protein
MAFASGTDDFVFCCLDWFWDGHFAASHCRPNAFIVGGCVVFGG